ncbi:MAG: ATP-binding protein [Propionibacteriaceae bacterium]|jgi:SpoVK/Ycf46/Vps4 family AAA+-type ATPase|nr:ATP-binding protein [Propionibacteriaceae bacterium]
MASAAEHVTAMIRSHSAGDDEGFYAVALQAAAREARQGHTRLADDIKKAVDASRSASPSASITHLARPKGDVADLVAASNPEVGLRDLVLPDDLLASLRRVLDEQRQRARLLDHGFVPAHRLLLEGPPGTGKTMTAAVLARELSLPLFTVRLDGLLSKYMGETAGKLRLLFDEAGRRRGVYLFDEFDALGGDRSGNDVGEARRILNSFLVFLEQAGPESVVVAATNHRAILDRALFRRFDLVLTYRLPEGDQVRQVVRGRLGTMVRGLRWEKLDQAAEGLSHADLVEAAETAAKGALMRGQTVVTADDLVAALGERRAASGA